MREYPRMGVFSLGGYIMRNNGRRRNKKQVQPFWSEPSTIHHPLDDDIATSIRLGKEKYTALMMMDPSFDSYDCLYHLRWTDEDLHALIEGMVYRSLEILRFAAPTNPLYQEEVAWIISPQFTEYCRFLGMDAQVIRSQLQIILKKYGKEIDFDFAIQFFKLITDFALLYKETYQAKIHVEGHISSLFNLLKKQVNDDYPLYTLLLEIGEFLDDLYLQGVSRDQLLHCLLAEINQ